MFLFSSFVWKFFPWSFIRPFPLNFRIENFTFIYSVLFLCVYNMSNMSNTLSKSIYMDNSQQTNKCSNSATIEALLKGAEYDNILIVDNKGTKTKPMTSHWCPYCFYYVLVSLLLTLNIFLSFFHCFYCWIWTSKRMLGCKSSASQKHKMSRNLEVS